MAASVSQGWYPLFVSYLNGAADAAELYIVGKHFLERIVARIAHHLPEDLREDVVDELFVRLLENPPRIASEKCSTGALVFNLLRNAVRHVRAEYAPPGQRTRALPEAQFSGPNEAEENKEPVLLDEQERIAEFLEAPLKTTTVEEAPSSRWSARSIEAYAEAGELLARLPGQVATAACMIHLEGHSREEAARFLGMSRFALSRALARVQEKTNPQPAADWMPPRAGNLSVITAA